MAVAKIAEYRSQETADYLQALADLAKAGHVVGVALCYRTDDRQENLAFTGIYKESPGKGVNAAMRLSWRLTQMQDELTGPP